MRKRIFLFLTVLIFKVGSSLGSDINWRTYSLKEFPISALGCVQTAKDLGERFAKVTGQEVFRSICEKESKHGYDIIVTYISPSPLRFISTLNESGGLGYQGLFSNLKDCQSAHN